MGNLLLLLVRNGGLLAFVLVEVFCFYLIVQNNEKQRVIFAHTQRLFAKDLFERRQNVMDYVGLKTRVDSLMAVNAQLNNQLAAAQVIHIPSRDTFYTVRLDSVYGIDSLKRKIFVPYYEYISAKVLSNNISSANNWLMLNRGSDVQIAPGMGVVSTHGIVGIVRHVDSDFCVVMSVLHRQTKISASLKKQDAFGSLIWEGGDPSIMLLTDIPKHHLVQSGDSVMTSRFSQKFPPNLFIGRVEGDPFPDADNPCFTKMEVRLSQDMSTVYDVHVVNNPMSLKQETILKKADDK